MFTSKTLPRPDITGVTTDCVPDKELMTATVLPPVYILDLRRNTWVSVPELVMVIAVPASASCGVSANLTRLASPTSIM